LPNTLLKGQTLIVDGKRVVVVTAWIVLGTVDLDAMKIDLVACYRSPYMLL
jgi:hypothetical protein